MIFSMGKILHLINNFNSFVYLLNLIVNRRVDANLIQTRKFKGQTKNNIKYQSHQNFLENEIYLNFQSDFNQFCEKDSKEWLIKETQHLKGPNLNCFNEIHTELERT